MSFSGVNYLAILIAAVAGFAVSGIWYTLLFARPWMAAQGLTEEAILQRGPSPRPFVIALIANLVMALILAVIASCLENPTLPNTIGIALLVWIGFVITVLLVVNQFEDRKPMLTIIDGGNWLAVLVVMGAIIGAFG